MKAGDVVLVRGTGFIAAAIKWFTHSKYSHAALALNADFLIEAQGMEGIQIVPVTKYKNEYDVYTYPSLSDIERSRVVSTAFSIRSQHYGYDYWDIVRLAIRSLFHWELPYTEKKRTICSQFVALSYDGAGIELVDEPDCDVTPEDLAESKKLVKGGN